MLNLKLNRQLFYNSTLNTTKMILFEIITILQNTKPKADFTINLTREFQFHKTHGKQ